MPDHNPTATYADHASLPLGFTTPPMSLDCEGAVLGALMVRFHEHRLPMIRGLLTADDFYDPMHRKLFRLIGRMIDEDEIVSFATVAARIDGDDDFQQANGRNYLAAIARSAEYDVDPETHAHVVLDMSCRRQIMEAAMTAHMAAAVRDGEYQPWSEIAASLATALDQIGVGRAATSQTGGDTLVELAERLETPAGEIKTGYAEFDANVGGGLQTEDGLYIVEAPPKHFKSGVIGGLMEGVIRNGTRAALFSLEMRPTSMMQRLVAGRYGIGYETLGRQLPRDEAVRLVMSYRAEIRADELLRTTHCPGIEIDRLRAEILRSVYEHGSKVVFVDYWQRIRGQTRDQRENQHLERCADLLSDLAGKHGVAVVMASQMNREGKSLGSDGALRACSWFATVHKVAPPEGSRGVPTGLWLKVSANRYGPEGSIGTEEQPAFEIAAGPVLRVWDAS